MPTTDVPPYVSVVQVIGACSGSDIAGYVAACDATGATNTTCNNWFNSASASCASCLIGPETDAGVPTRQGAIWFDYQYDNLGPNYAGCMDKKGMSACGSAYDNLWECVYAAGCITCGDTTSFDTCVNTVTGTGGPCSGYVTPYQTSCAADFADGGLLNGGPCSTDTEVFSVLCGNGSGDGG